MTLWEAILGSALARDAGWVLLHFLWQGTLVALGVAAACSALAGRSPAARYAVGCAGLAVMALCPLATYLWIREPLGAAPGLSAALRSTLRTSLGSTLEPPGRVAELAPLLACAWALGALLQQARLVAQWVLARRLARRGTLPLPASLADAARDLARRLGIPRPVRVVQSSFARVPAAVGWLRPVVLVPTYALTGLSPLELRAVLAHELAHVRRCDALVNLLQVVAESFLFFHPAVWWLSGRVRTEREYCCDDQALRLVGGPFELARALVALDGLCGEESALALASTGGPLMKRIQRIVGAPGAPRQGAALRLVPAAALALLALTAASALGSSSDGQESPPPRAQDGELERMIRELDAHIAAIEARLERLRARAAELEEPEPRARPRERAEPRTRSRPAPRAEDRPNLFWQRRAPAPAPAPEAAPLPWPAPAPRTAPAPPAAPPAPQPWSAPRAERTPRPPASPAAPEAPRARTHWRRTPPTAPRARRGLFDRELAPPEPLEIPEPVAPPEPLLPPAPRWRGPSVFGQPGPEPGAEVFFHQEPEPPEAGEEPAEPGTFMQAFECEISPPDVFFQDELAEPQVFLQGFDLAEPELFVPDLELAPPQDFLQGFELAQPDALDPLAPTAPAPLRFEGRLDVHVHPCHCKDEPSPAPHGAEVD